ncbi:uncharacterized protein TRAVEDRAFT_147095, partial [Trametes versicolor FP-101664 SS1]|uniref:uncharacterized protein n=1 Tax=Trametes versicolor (strain FP-101664) TaxID=717944 RepID=UPI00046241C0
MDTLCVHCQAHHWIAERLSESSASRPLFGFCCDKGQVALEPLPEPPLALRTLLTGDTPQAVEFRNNIRQYNAAFAFTSLGVAIDDSVTTGHGPYVFRIHGELCHRSGSLLPAEGNPPSYAQLYIFDPRLALAERVRRNANLRRDTLQRIQAMLSATHRYAAIYRHAHEVLSLQEDADLAVRLAVQPNRDRRRYNLPSADDVAVVLPGAEGETRATDGRDIILRRRSGALQRIHEAHPAYAPLHYTLLFPFGTHGWHWDLHMGDGARRLSQTRFYAYQLQVRPDEFSTILRSGRLFQQYIVDMWAAAEQNRLRYLRLNQQQLRAAVYSGLEDALRGGRDVDLNELGQLIVLPSSFTGSPRHMQQLFQDGMAIARFYRNIDIFLTMTANP